MLHCGVSKSLQFLNLLNRFYYGITWLDLPPNLRQSISDQTMDTSRSLCIDRLIFHRFIMYSIVLCLLVSQNLLLNIFMEKNLIKNDWHSKWQCFSRIYYYRMNWENENKFKSDAVSCRSKQSRRAHNSIYILFGLIHLPFILLMS